MQERNIQRERRRRTLDRRLREAKLVVKGRSIRTIRSWRTSFRSAAVICRARIATNTTISRSLFLSRRCSRRLELLGKLKTGVITLSGGEPLLHPELDDIIRAIRQQRHSGRPDHQRLSADGGTDSTTERCRSGLPPDQHRQRHAGRGIEEEPEGARQEAAAAVPSTRLFTSTSTPCWAAESTTPKTLW